MVLWWQHDRRVTNLKVPNPSIFFRYKASWELQCWDLKHYRSPHDALYSFTSSLLRSHGRWDLGENGEQRERGKKRHCDNFTRYASFQAAIHQFQSHARGDLQTEHHQVNSLLQLPLFIATLLPPLNSSSRASYWNFTAQLGELASVENSYLQSPRK